MALRRFVLVASVALSWIGAGAAQDRMPPIPKEKWTDAQKKAAEEIIQGPRGELVGPFIPLLRSPEFMSRLQRTGEYVRYKTSIPAELNEFGILLTARGWSQEFEWSVHAPIAIKAGLNPEIVKAVAEGRRPTGMSADEELVYDFNMELRANQSVSDATYSRAVKRFGEQGVIDLTGLAGYYTLLSMIMNVARTPTPVTSGEPPALAPFPH